MDDDPREVIRWLESWAGRRWSRELHQPLFGHWFCLKRDLESFCYGYDDEGWDDMMDVELMDLGWCDSSGRYRKPSRFKRRYGAAEY